jgi:hypothetical protein
MIIAGAYPANAVTLAAKGFQSVNNGIFNIFWQIVIKDIIQDVESKGATFTTITINHAVNEGKEPGGSPHLRPSD